MLNNDLGNVMSKDNSITVHEVANIANSSVIKVLDTTLIEYKYIALCRISATFTLSTSRPAGALFSFADIAPTGISALGNIIDTNGNLVSRFYLGVSSVVDPDGNKYVENLSAIQAGTYYINEVCSLK